MLMHATRFRYVDERELQDQIENDVLRPHGIAYAREVILSPKDRIDFLCGSVGIEVKIAGSIQAVQRQLWRYAAQDRITNLILVTTRAKHKDIPSEILGKRVRTVHLLNSIF